MGHLKLMGLVFVFIISEVKQIHSEEINNFVLTWTRTFNKSVSEPLFLTLNNSYIRIACERELTPSFIITPIDSDTSCFVPANKKCPYDLHAVALGNGKIVFENYIPGSDKEYFNIVNPITCSVKTFELNSTEDRRQIVPYFDTFDMVNHDIADWNYTIYRYDDEGVLYDTINKTNLNSLYRTFFTFKEATPKSTYFAYSSSSSLKGEKSEINALNANYWITKTLQFDHDIDVFSTEHNRFGLCYANFGPNQQGSMDCKILDSKFKSLGNVTAIKIDKLVNSMDIHNTIDGGAIVVYVAPNVYYTRINLNGGVSDKNTVIAERSVYDTQVYIREMNAATNEYCIYVSLKFGKELKAYCNNA